MPSLLISEWKLWIRSANGKTRFQPVLRQEAHQQLFLRGADMSSITIETFKQAVARYFEPITREHGWPLIRRGEDVYETPSPYFVMRIRFHVGAHAKSINATLIPIDQMPGNIAGGGCGELGVGVIAGYNGVEIKHIPWENTAEGLFEEAQHVANMVKTYAIPYLLGQKFDWSEVNVYLQNIIAKDLETIRGYKFPPSVQERWHLPPPPDTDEKP